MQVDSGTTITVNNVLVGEIWVCAGQSNMQFGLATVADGAKEVSEAKYSGIRLLAVPDAPSESPLTEIYNTHWVECSPDTVKNFSAVGYFFGRELHRKLGVPVGLIDATWGGTKAEPWTSLTALRKIPFLAPVLSRYEQQIAKSQHERKLGIHPLPFGCSADLENVGFPFGWADIPSPAGDWAEMELPAKWQERGLDFSGILWFRKEFAAPPEWVGRELKLLIGAADKNDITYFNTVKVGGRSMADSPTAYRDLREYKVPGTLAKPGRNVVAVRVYSDVFDGGLTGPAEAMRVSCPSLPNSAGIPLDGIWKYAIESNFGHRDSNSPTELFNGMISPLTRFAIRGAVWYQGESNEFVPFEYKELLPALIEDWRGHWGQGDFPFLIVQLPNFREPQAFDAKSAWAQLREAQLQALRLPNTGMAVTIDLGEEADVHPKNKKPVGLRLALNALSKVYGQKMVTPSGPLYKACKVEGTQIRLLFDDLGGGLEARGGELKAFAIAGADQKFLPADARIEGDTVVVSSPEVSAPVAVRYGWADNPPCNLYNRAGLPASPFRTDDWVAALQSQ